MIYTHPLFEGPYNPIYAFIPINRNFVTEWGGLEHQLHWGELCLKATLHCHDWLSRKEEIPNLIEILEFLAFERRKIALILDQINMERPYGLFRINNTLQEETYISTFTPERLRCKDQFENLVTSFKNSNTKFALPIYYDANNSILQVSYPDSSAAQKLLLKANDLWKAARLKNSIDPKETYTYLAKILWHLALSRFLAYGTAATSEMFYHTLCLQFNLPLLPLQSTEPWDIKALFTESEDEFASWFINNCIPLNEINFSNHAVEKKFSTENDNLLSIQANNIFQDFLHTKQPKLHHSCLLPIYQDKYNLTIAHYFILQFIDFMHSYEAKTFLIDNTSNILPHFLTIKDNHGNSLNRFSGTGCLDLGYLYAKLNSFDVYGEGVGILWGAETLDFIYFFLSDIFSVVLQHKKFGGDPNSNELMDFKTIAKSVDNLSLLVTIVRGLWVILSREEKYSSVLEKLISHANFSKVLQISFNKYFIENNYLEEELKEEGYISKNIYIRIINNAWRQAWKFEEDESDQIFFADPDLSEEQKTPMNDLEQRSFEEIEEVENQDKDELKFNEMISGITYKEFYGMIEAVTQLVPQSNKLSQESKLYKILDDMPHHYKELNIDIKMVLEAIAEIPHKKNHSNFFQHRSRQPEHISLDNLCTPVCLPKQY